MVKMKSDNKYLRTINENFGGQVDSRKPDNYYLKHIAENTGSDDLNGHRPNNYYLKQIAENTEDIDIAEMTATIRELRQEVEDLTIKANNEIILFGEKSLIQKDESANVSAYCKVDGNKMVDGTIYFFEVID